MSDKLKKVATDIKTFSDFIENDCYYLKKKLFRKYLEDLYNTTGKKSIFFEVYSKKQLLQAIEIIKQYE